MDFSPPDRSTADPTHHPDSHPTHDSAPQVQASAWVNLAETPTVTSMEWQNLRYRVVALENLLIALMADGSASRLDRAREMARHVAPRLGCTEHPVSLFAAAQIVHLVERARRVMQNPSH